MFMHKTLVELKRTIEKLENELTEEKERNHFLGKTREFDKRDAELKAEERLNELRKEMTESLYKSDMRRVAAEAKLEIYEKIDTKDDAKKIREMLADAIKGLSQKPAVQIVK